MNQRNQTRFWWTKETKTNFFMMMEQFSSIFECMVRGHSMKHNKGKAPIKEPIDSDGEEVYCSLPNFLYKGNMCLLLRFINHLNSHIDGSRYMTFFYCLPVATQFQNAQIKVCSYSLIAPSIRLQNRLWNCLLQYDTQRCYLEPPNKKLAKSNFFYICSFPLPHCYPTQFSLCTYFYFLSSFYKNKSRHWKNYLKYKTLPPCWPINQIRVTADRKTLHGTGTAIARRTT
jgi:hypothetical protein